MSMPARGRPRALRTGTLQMHIQEPPALWWHALSLEEKKKGNKKNILRQPEGRVHYGFLTSKLARVSPKGMTLDDNFTSSRSGRVSGCRPTLPL
eukprot:1161591-Pelagomonas_calceolata.AAC.4